MQASPSPSEPGGGYGSRRGHVPQLSISDPSHHVTEAIGHMYDDDYDKRDSRRLSFISSPLSESITIIPSNLAGCEAPTSPQSVQIQNHLSELNHRPTNGQSWSHGARSVESSPTSPVSTTSPGSTDTATTSFPLNDIDYESDPAAVAQELSNLAAIRRMSMDVAATGDPDLPSFSVPSIAPSPSADENDASRLFWVPARLHPELAPKEFKSFLESKTDQIKRKSGDYSALGPEREGSIGSLRRKKSMLSRQIDTSQGYTDGAERLERKRSQSQRESPASPGPNLHELETIVDDVKPRATSASSILNGIQQLGISADDDRPILPPAPPGHSLRRSTRTQYRKAGSLKKGEKAPYSKRMAKGSDPSEPLPSSGGQTNLTRVSTDPTPSVTRAQALAKSGQGAPQAPSTTASSTSNSAVDQSQSATDRPLDPASSDTSNRAGAPAHSRQWHSRISSNGRSTLNVPPPEQQIPEIVETPPPETTVTPPAPTPQPVIPPKAPVIQDKTQERSSSKRSAHSRTHAKDTTPTLNEFANSPPALPGNSNRTDNLSYIPTFSDDRKSDTKDSKESKKSKDKKDSEGGRKSSWHWLLGTDDKDKDKEKKKEKDSDSKKLKAKLVDKVHETTHSAPSSNDTASQRGRESLVLDRLDPKLEDERRKDNGRRTSGEAKKDKESGLFSSIFGGGRKKSGGDSGHHHKKSASRNLSPDPPVRELRPDVDYAWTRFSILEERAIYRMAHIKLANPRRALYSQVLLSNFMYSYLAKVQQMHPHMMLATSAAQRQQRQQEEYQQYQRYQESQEQQQYADSSYDDPQMYEYNDDQQDPYHSQSHGSKGGYENGNAYGPGHYQYDHSSFGDDVQLDDDDDDMW
ncbi:hypothetical protein BO70DRAFT_62209 [Aspergillus heteromorphus CBS 117.55]|uniref:Protein Zds1 C-terminal domain-containing protein n=1 Tax=Aspergillus heteromorphus CBS 117.55 TaxID=1448321 RepID=A0A317VV97_9EURO|nr:uncharacterized protein BO70DRAFT_62209 [Aspergillus heteromorphus CBS 117.55]PWY78324.1 hypothetical protein BO70DRAFT_62209 [Aspergillus heteromorphus CBS 117.55]